MKGRKILGWDSIVGYSGEGMIIELGVWRGDSFNEICKYANPRKVYGFDWFRGLPERWTDYPIGEIEDPRPLNQDGKPPLCPDNGEFVIGKVEDTLAPFMKDNKSPIGFVHFDLDLYSGTKLALETLSPNFRPGTVLAFDEIDSAVRNVNHEQAAFREWISRTTYDVELLGQRHPESWVIRLT